MKNTLETMVKNANAIENAMYTETTIPTDITKHCDKLNLELFSEVTYKLATASYKDFINAFFNVKVKEGLKENEVMNAMKNAVSCKEYEIIVNDNSLLEIKAKIKAISFTDILNHRIQIEALENADYKPTAKNKANAVRHFFGTYGKGYIDILTHNARLFTSIGNTNDSKEDIKLNANGEKSMEMLNEKYTKIGKENPFVNNSKNALTAQIMDAVEYFTDNTDIKMYSYHCKALFQMICNRNRYGKLTIAKDTDVMNMLAIVYRYAYNGYKLPTTDKTDIYKTTK